MTHTVGAQTEAKVVEACKKTGLAMVRERLRQLKRWGVQRHPFVGVGLEPYYEFLANDAKAQFVEGETAWDMILLEEVYEALAETSRRKIRDELVQVIAVAQAMIEQCDEELATTTTTETRPA